MINKLWYNCTVVVAQLVEWLLPIPEVRFSNPVIGKIYWIFVYCQLYWKDENKKKRPGMAHLKQVWYTYLPKWGASHGWIDQSKKIKVFIKMGQSRPLFVYFCSFLVTISIQIDKSIDGVLGIWTQGRRMVGADETMELWRPPKISKFKEENQNQKNRLKIKSRGGEWKFLSWLGAASFQGKLFKLNFCKKVWLKARKSGLRLFHPIEGTEVLTTSRWTYLTHHNQCDQMAKLFFNIWSFATIKMCQITYKVCQTG